MTKTNIIFLGIVFLSLLLRLYKLTQVPISLHGDELGVGYNAYSLLVSGKDEYENYFPLTFRADVTPLIFYATIPSIALFGTSDFAIRFPSVIIGVTTVIMFYFFVEVLVKTFNITSPANYQKIALLATFFLSIAPWHIQISRIAHDASYGILIQFLALYCFLKYTQQHKRRWFFFSAIFFGFSFYAYHAPLLTSPLLIGVLLWFFRKEFTFKKTFMFLCTFILITTPFMHEYADKPIAQTRFGGISIFVRESPNENRLISVPIKLAKNYATHLNPLFLFAESSAVRYFNVKYIGLFLIITVPFLLSGIYQVRKNKRAYWFFLLWGTIAILPGALTLGPPNAGRAALFFPLIDIFAALGIFFLSVRLNKTLLAFAISFNLALFLYSYFVISPIEFTSQWQYGVKEIISYAIDNERNYDEILVSNKIKQAYIYMLFYGNKNPTWTEKTSPKTRNSFVGYDVIGKYEFRNISLDKDKQKPRSLIIVPANDAVHETAIYTVFSPTQQPLYKAITTN